MGIQKTPSPLLTKIIYIPDEPVSIALCPDFEFGSWRYKQLAAHLFDWLPDVALRPHEREALLYEPNKQLSTAARRLFDVEDADLRGEIGEILVHIACRQEFGTIPFVSRLFYKMRSNDSVTSVDIVHLNEEKKSKKIHLWLGEAKIYQDLDQAKYAAFQSIEPLWDQDFLAEMKALIGPKMEKQASSEELIWLFSDETSLDNIVDRIVIPICIACDFDPTKEATKRTESYIEEVKNGVENIRNYMKKKIPTEIKFVCIFIPMDNKNKLCSEVNKKAKAMI